jgi:hypothetical protein
MTKYIRYEKPNSIMNTKGACEHTRKTKQRKLKKKKKRTKKEGGQLMNKLPLN